MTLDATIGGASSDTYSTLAEYTTYAADMGWTIQSTDPLNEADLRRARMYLDRQYEWIGYRVTSTQLLQWPRTIGGYVENYTVANNIIPQSIKDAQCELAYLIKGGLDPFKTVKGGSLQSTKAGPVSVTYSTSRETPRIVAIDGMVAPYGSKKGSIVNLVRA
jgi:hypothetical protein